MSLLPDIVKALGQWKEWKAIQEAPGRIEELTDRVSDLEARLSDNPNAERCEHCGSSDIQITGTRKEAGRWGKFGVRETRYECQNDDCGKETWIMDKPPS